jgi:kynureninase
MKFQNFEFVGQLDIQDPFKQILRGEFIFQKVNGKSTYFTGNSLGLQPKRTKVL